MSQDDTVVAIIDEAQNLPEEVLEDIGRMFSLDHSISTHLQIIFVGQPQLEEKLTSQRLRQIHERLKLRLHIEALTRKESEDYIEHRLKRVGSSTAGIFTPKAISIICTYARGIPRIINTLCDNALHKSYSVSGRRIDFDVIRKVIRSLEGPMSRENLLCPVITPLRGICPFIPRLILTSRQWSIAILLFTCLVGLVFVAYEYRQSRSINTWRSNTSLQSPHHVSIAGASPHPVLKEERKEEIVTVKEGQTISSLAEEFYSTLNPALITFILDFNPEVTNADFITVGQKIRVPKPTEESLILMADQTYKIHVGTFVTPESQTLYRNEPALKGKEIEILPRKVSPKTTWYRIVIGKFDYKEEALRTAGLLKEKGLLPLFLGASKK